MIRYRFPGLSLAQEVAATCEHPRLQRLQNCGPWRVTVAPGQRKGRGAVELEQVVRGWRAADWLPWAPGLDGCEVSIASNVDLRLLSRGLPPTDATWVRFVNRMRLPVRPAYCEGLQLSLTGEVLPQGPGPYWGALRKLADLGAAATWADSMSVAQHAIESWHRCPQELSCHLRLLTTADIAALVRVASGDVGEKKASAGASSSSDSPESTGEAAP